MSIHAFAVVPDSPFHLIHPPVLTSMTRKKFCPVRIADLRLQHLSLTRNGCVGTLKSVLMAALEFPIYPYSEYSAQHFHA